ncbi:unnamed protein product [Ambrosiozyma monospora]|uniref:Unnamed protein product n=1 Tax=Ambrosiozyma monospora TaxID=43982 RepID=A0ACB5TQP5_AMBMO|nr:unnamed protein product [Ambrosiozyma monospora]
MKVPQNRPAGIDRDTYSKHLAKVAMALFGLSHTYYTKVGDDFVRGVSGGERKRVSIAEVTLSGGKLECWDNSTRGLDSASAENFVKTLKMSSEVLDTTGVVSIYQCSQGAYDYFDNALVLYEGRQIYFGNAQKAQAFFERMGYECPPRQTTPDFLTSLTSPMERTAKKGWESRVPRTPEEFEAYWKNSPEYQELLRDIDEYMQETDNAKAEFTEHLQNSKAAKQANGAPHKQPYTLSYGMQVKYLTRRAFQRIRGNLTLPLFTIFSNFFMALINGSVFYNLGNTVEDIYFRGACLFFACLFNSMMSLLEIFALYEARPIVEKHRQYGFYHPSAEAFASIFSEIPTKVITSTFFNITLYFMANLRRDAGHFFYYFFIGTLSLFIMSHMFRTIGSLTKSISEAMTPASLLVLAMSVYAGFIVPTNYMLGWSRYVIFFHHI